MPEPIKNYGLVGSSEPDNLINQTSPSLLSTGVEVKDSQGELKRGTALGYVEVAGVLDTSGLVKLDATGKAFYVLAEDINTDDEDSIEGLVTAIAYTSGHFNRNIVNEITGITLSFNQENELREKGIFLSDAKK